MSKVYNDEIKDLVTKLSAINSSDFESILKAVEAEKESRKKRDIDSEAKTLAEEINSGDYLKYKDAAYKLAALYLDKLIDEVEPDIADALRLVQHNLIEDTKSLDSYVKIRNMQKYLKHYIANCVSYNEHFMPVHYTIATKAKHVLSKDCFYNDLNYEVKLEAIYNMAKSSAFLE